MKVWMERLDELWRLALFLAILGGIAFAGYLGLEALGMDAWGRGWSIESRLASGFMLMGLLVVLPLTRSLDRMEKRVDRLSEQVYELRRRADADRY